MKKNITALLLTMLHKQSFAATVVAAGSGVSAGAIAELAGLSPAMWIAATFGSIYVYLHHKDTPRNRIWNVMLSICLGVAGGGPCDGVEQGGVAGAGAEADALDAQLSEGEEFIGFADAVLVEVFPEFDAGKGNIVAVELAVGNTCRIDVQVGQGGKAVGGQLAGIGAVGEDGAVAKEFSA